MASTRHGRSSPPSGVCLRARAAPCSLSSRRPLVGHARWRGATPSSCGAAGVEVSGGESVASRSSLPTRASTFSRRAHRAAPAPPVRECRLSRISGGRSRRRRSSRRPWSRCLSCSVRLAAWADERRWARARLSGLVGSFAQFHKLAGLDRGREPFATWRFARRLPPPQTAADADGVGGGRPAAATDRRRERTGGVAGAVGAQAGTGCRGLPGRCPGRA